MGSHIMEESPEEKYLGDMIHTDGLAASILSTVNKRLGVLISKINVIMNLAENPKMYGLKNSLCVVEQDRDQGGLETGAKALVGNLVLGEQGVTPPPNQPGSDSKDSEDYAGHTCPGGGISKQ